MLDNETRVGVTGDWHGNTGWVLPVLKNYATHGIKHIIQVGDFGFIWGGQDTATGLRKLIRDLERNEQILYIVPGNHEDYARIEQTEVNADGTQHYQSDRIRLLPRGFRGNIGELSFVALGGANSVDFEGRTEWLSWWRAESITLGDVYKTVEGGTADLMFTHDVPTGVVLPHDNHDNGWSPTALRYSNEGREILRQAVNSVKPEMLFHGHHHLYQDIVSILNDGVDNYAIRTVGLARDTMPASSIIFDAEEKTYEII